MRLRRYLLGALVALTIAAPGVWAGRHVVGDWISGFFAEAEQASYDAVVNGTTGVTAWSDGTVTSYTNKCLQMQEAVNRYLDTSVTTYQDYSVRYTGNFSVAWTDFYDQGPYRTCLAIFPTASVIGAQGTGGFSTSDSARTGWPEIQTRVVATGMGARTATGGTGTTIVDADGSTLAGEVGKYVRITAGTCSGNTRYISVAAATTLTVDTAWSAACVPDATSVFDVFTIPQRTSGGQHLRIVWDNVRINVTQTGQGEPGVVVQRGNAWACGETSAASEGSPCQLSNGFESGEYAIQISGTDAGSTGWVNGRLAEISATTLTNADNALIAEVNFGVLRWPSIARVTLSGGGTRSQDNIGIWSAGTWGSSRKGTHNINLFGNAITLWFNNYGSWENFYVANNHVGVSFGTGTAGGEMQYLGTCTSGYCSNSVIGGNAHGATFVRALFESNDYGQILAFDTDTESGFEDLHLENGTVSGHQIVMGAGQCSAADATTVGRPCAQDANCGTGVCSANGGTTQQNGFFFRGGSLGSMSQAAASPNWRQFILGTNFTQNSGIVTFSGGVVLPLTTVPANSTGTLPCTGAGAPYWYCTGANTNAQVFIGGHTLPSVTTGIDAAVHYLDARFSGTSQLLWPYRYITAANQIILGPFTNEVNLAANDALQLGGPRAALVTPTANNVQLWGWPHVVEGNATDPNLYLNKMICSPGSYDDGGEAAEVHTWRPLIGDATSLISSTAFGTITFTEGTDAPGTSKGTAIAANTVLFNCNTGTCATKNAPSIGIILSSETDVGANNTSKVSCIITAIPSFGNDY